MNNYKKIGIIYKPTITNVLDICKNIQKSLQCKEILTIVSEITNPPKNIDLAIIVGGDGTILKAARFYAEFNIPIFGLNLGRLGFLAQADISEIESALNCISNNQFSIDERLMLSIEEKNITALNDIVIKNINISKTLDMMVYINNHLVSNYLADGLIISTPTGSTAYTLSAGGPVLYPSLDAICLVPICPHTLAARPLVIPSDEIIEIKCKNEHDNFSISVDGQINIENLKSVKINKSKNKAQILLLNREDNSFYSVLRRKLNWAIAPQV